MRNFVQRTQGTQLAPRAVTAGELFQVGTMVCIAKHAAASGAAVETGELPGTYLVAKTTGQAWAVGVKLYWDNTGFLVTSTAGSNQMIGNAQVAALSAAATGYVYLDGTAR